MYLSRIIFPLMAFCLFYCNANSQTTTQSLAKVEVDSLIQASRQLLASRKIDEATALVEKAEQKIIENFGKDSEEYAIAMLGWSRIYMGKGDMQNSEKTMLLGRSFLDSIGKKETEMYGTFCYGLCTFYHRIQKFEQAEPFCLEGLEVRERVLQPENPDIAISYNSLGVLYRAAGKYEKALVNNIKARELLIEHNNTSHNYYQNVNTNLSNLYVEMGNFEKGEELLNEAIAFKAQAVGTNNIEYARALSNLGILYQKQGKYEEAKPLYSESTRIAKEVFGSEHQEYAKFIGSEAILYCIINDYEKAEPLLLEASRIITNTIGTDNTTYALNINNLGNLYMQNGYYSKAEPIYIEHNRLMLKLLGDKHPSYGLGLGNLALLYNTMGRFSEAEPLVAQAKDITLASYGRDNLTTAFMYLVYGESLVGKKLYNAARENLEESADIRKKLIGENTIDYAEALDKLGKVSSLMDSMSLAENYYLKARDIREKAVGINHDDYSRSLEGLANFYQRIGEVDKAETYWLDLNKQSKRKIQKVSAYSSENEVQALLSSFQLRMAGFSSFAQDHPSPKMLGALYDNYLFLNGYLLENKKALTTSIADADSLTQATYQQWLDLQIKLATEYSKPVAEQKNIAEMENNSETAEKTLVKNLNHFKATINPTTWQDVQKSLKSKEVAVEFINYQYFDPEITDSTFYSALVLEPGWKSPKLIRLFEEKQLTENLNYKGSRKSQYVNGLYSYENGANKLNDFIYKPLKEYFSPKNKSKVYFIPSGLLHRINLGAIPIGENNYLGDQITLTELSSGRQIVENKSANDQQKSVLLVGGINYDIDRMGLKPDSILPAFATRGGLFEEIPLSITEEINRGGSWNYLKGTEIEISNIRQIMDKSGITTTIMNGDQATEKAFKLISSQKSPDIIHLATHGYFFPESKSDTSGKTEPIFKASDNPMIRSGLLLSGGNYTWKTGAIHPSQSEDGILTAREISQMDLSNTKLVVLSACETGLGEIKGEEGVYGLQRAFKLAGVDYLIMSLWQVPDGQTSELMTAFYENWMQNKMTIPAAFASAQKSIRAKYEHPYFWAGFVLLR